MQRAHHYYCQVVYEALYYLFCLGVYLLMLLSSIYFSKCLKRDKKLFSKLDSLPSEGRFRKRKPRKKRKRIKKLRRKDLPLFHRFIYYVWLFSIIVLLVGFPILFGFLRYWLIGEYFVPAETLYYESSPLSTLTFGAGSFFCAIPLLVLYSYITNRGIVRKADIVYQMGSFQEYSKLTNIFICEVLLIIFLPVMILSFNSYRYVTDAYFAQKSSFSLTEERYSYDEIDYVELKLYKGGSVHYTAVLEDERKVYLGEELRIRRDDFEILSDLLEDKGIRIEEVE